MVAHVRLDLNGLRLFVPGQPEVWLIFEGLRHHISSAVVYDALFSTTDNLTEVDSVAGILRGPDLNNGTCLARGQGEIDIYFVTGYPETKVCRRLVPDYETFLSYGFDETLVLDVPPLLLAGVPAGRPLEMRDLSG